MTVQLQTPSPALTIQSEEPGDAAAIEALLDRAFGPGRYTKVSERVREMAAFAPELSFCAWEDGTLVGVVRMWRIAIGKQPAIFLGPLAVERDQRLAGVGGRLVEQACQAARSAGETAVLLVGDEPYFSGFGFAAAPARAVRLPGPVDQRRVQLRRLTADAKVQVGDVRGPQHA